MCRNKKAESPTELGGTITCVIQMLSLSLELHLNANSHLSTMFTIPLTTTLTPYQHSVNNTLFDCIYIQNAQQYLPAIHFQTYNN